MIKKLLSFFVLLIQLQSTSAQYRCIPHLDEYGTPGDVLGFAQYTDYYPMGFGPSSTPVWSGVQSIGFPFYFNGQLVTKYKISSTGVLTFDTLASIVPPLNNNMLPDTQIPDNSICIRGIGAINASSIVKRKNTFNYSGSIPCQQHWIFFMNYADTIASPSEVVTMAIVLEQNTNHIYIADIGHSQGYNPMLTLGIQLNSTTAYMAAGSPQITPQSISSAPYYTGTVYYTFIPGANSLNHDGAITASSIQAYSKINDAPFAVQAKFRNLGTDTVHSFQLHYNINGGNTYSESFSGLNIACGRTQWFNFNTPFNPTVAGNYNLDFWVDNLNGATDDDPTNDHFFKQIYVSNTLPPRRVMFEEFKGTGCSSSGYYTESYDSLLGLNSNKVSSIKYECYFPSVLGFQGSNDRLNFYNHWGAPFAFANGLMLKTVGNNWQGCPWNATQPIIDSLYNLPGLFDIQPQFHLNGYTATVTGTVTSAVDFIQGTHCKVFIALVEDTIIYATPQGNSNETNFYNTTRKLLPSGKGVYIGTPHLGQVDSLNISILLADTTINPSNLKVVVFVQDSITKEIYQSSETPGIIDCPAVMNKTYHHICAGDSIYMGGNWFTWSGISPTLYTNSDGCDSLQMDIVKWHSLSCYIELASWSGNQWLQNEWSSPNYSPNTDVITYQWYDVTNQQIILGANSSQYDPTYSGDFALIISNQVGCVDTSNIISFHCINSFSNWVTVCSGDSIHVGSHWYSVQGNYSDTLQTIAGCDSVVNTQLYVSTINNVVGVYGTQLGVANGYTSYEWIDCNTGLTLPVTTNNMVGTYPGSYKVIITNSNGCISESDCTPTALICPYYNFQQYISICAGDSMSVGNIWHSLPGYYADTLEANWGCDSIIRTTLYVINTNTTLNTIGNFIYSPNGNFNYTYEWIDCNTGLSFPDSTSSFLPPYSGSFKAIITSTINNCSAESDCISMVITAINGSQKDQGFSLSPNPTMDETTLIFKENPDNAIVEITDLSGKNLQQINVRGAKTVISLANYQAGVYYIKLYENNCFRSAQKIVVIR
ncbi:MAG TPA: T9SS type A sorting domain-containing protein [Bacteroidia bacterium]|nr:T9SS type A sorting domain-containing protein [Bacteroidia bacterium]